MVKLTSASLALLEQAKKNKGVVNPQQNFTTGNTKKQYVTNSTTGNISVDGRVVTPTSAAYKATLSAMQSDTGNKFNQADSAMTGNGKFNVNGGMTNMSSDQVMAQIAQQKAERAAANQTAAANQASQNAYNSQASAIGSEYANVYKQLAASNMQEQYKMPQLMAAQGISGGGSESALMQQQQAYGNQLTQAQIAEKNALSDAYSTMANNQYNANVAGAANQATLQSNYANQLQEASRYKDEQTATAKAQALAAQQTESDRKAEIYKMQLSLGAVTPEAAAYYGLTTQQLQNALYPTGTTTTTTGTTASKKKVSSGSNSGGSTKKSNTSSEKAKTQSLASVASSKFGSKDNISGQYNALDYLLKNAGSASQAASIAKSIGISDSIINTWFSVRSQVSAGQAATGR